MNNELYEVIKNAKEADVTYLKRIEELIDKGININSNFSKPYGIGATPLTLASSCGNLKIVKFLVEKGADVNLINAFEWSALMSAVSSKHSEITKFLIKKGADVNLVNAYDWTALMSAVSTKRLDIVELLIKNGANIHVKNKDGKTALTIANECENSQIAELLKSME